LASSITATASSRERQPWTSTSFALELLVDREEVGDLALELLGDVVEGLGVVPAGVVVGDADDLVVHPLLVLHLEQGDRLDGDDAAGEGRLGDADEAVERVVVAPAWPIR
jgi:hypothetical protein